MIGIYKITSPSKRVYIGQSINIEKRFKQYRNLEKTHLQVRLFRSFVKYGVDKHKFEIVCTCSKNELNDMERFYQDCYSATNNSGLNCVLTKSTDRNGALSEDTKAKISAAHKGKTASDETRLKMSIAQKGKTISDRQKMIIAESSRNRSAEANARISKALKGVPRTMEARANMVLGNKNRTAEHKEKLRIAQTGRKYSDESKLKVSIASKLRASKEGAYAMQAARRKKIKDTHSGVIYSSLTEASSIVGIPRETLSGYLRGASPNKTTLMYI